MSHPQINKHLRTVEIGVAGGIVVACILGWRNLSSVPIEAKIFPSVLLIVLAGLALAIIGRAVLFPHAARLDDPDNKNWSFFRHIPRFVITLVVFVGYAFLLDILGFFTSSILFLVGLTLLLGYRQPVKIAIAYVCFLIFVYSIFVALFDRPLPKEFWLRTAEVQPSYVMTVSDQPRNDVTSHV